jgi:nucleoside-diphosphate-sugar epimerase
MNVFVTGATGLIGAATVRVLVARGHEVVGLTSRRAGVPAIEAAGARAVVGDMRDVSAYGDAARSADAVVHAAAAFPDKIRYGRADVDAFMGSDREAADALVSVLGPRCRIFLFSSGAYSYGDTGATPADETRSTDDHHAVVAKRVETERMLLDLARAKKAPAAIARPGLVYGDGSLWSKLYLDAMRRGSRAMMPGDGTNLVSFVHADDVGEAYRTIVERGSAGEIYNVADDEPAPLGDVTRAQAAALGAPPPWAIPKWLVRLVAGPYGAPAQLANTAITNRKLRALGWSPRYPTYREGIPALAAATRASAHA